MKVLYLALIELEVPTGPTVHTLNLMKGFQLTSTRVRLLCPKPAKEISEIADFDCCLIPFWGYSTLRLAAFNILSCFYLLKNIIFYKPDLLYLRDRFGNISAICLAKAFRIPFFIEMNGVLDADFASNNKIHRYLRKKQFQWAKGVVFNSRGLREKYSVSYNIEINKTSVLTMHVDGEIFFPMDKAECKKKLGIATNVTVIGYIGNICERYDIAILKRIIDILDENQINSALLIVGGVKNDEKILKLYEGMDKNRIVLPGWIPHNMVPRYINAMDIGTAFVNYSYVDDADAFTKVKEYLSCGVPVLMNSSGTSILEGYPKGAVTILPYGKSSEIPDDELENSVRSIISTHDKLRILQYSQFIIDKYNLKEAAERTSAFFRARMSDLKD